MNFQEFQKVPPTHEVFMISFTIPKEKHIFQPKTFFLTSKIQDILKMGRPWADLLANKFSLFKQRNEPALGWPTFKIA